MFVACWSVKGGSGTTVVSAALALSIAATGRDALLVDLAGLPKIPAQAISLVAATPFNFVGNKMWSFRLD